MIRFPVWISFCLVACLSGCGGGGSSSSGGGSNPSSPSSPSPTPDFTLSVAPATLAITAGGLSNDLTVSIAGSNGFTGAVDVSVSMPTGIGCGSVICSGQINTGASLTMQVQVASTLAAGNYNITFIGTSGTLSHQASLSVGVAVAAPVALPNHSAEVFTDDSISPGWGVAYDKVHDYIFLSNLQLCEVEVISPETLQVIRTIYVPSPTGMDLSMDGSTLYVGSNTQSLFAISTTSFQVQARIPFSGNPEFGFLFPSQVVTLADGTIAIIGTCGNINPCESGAGFFILNPATGAVTSPLTAIYPGALYATPLVASADRTRLFMHTPAGFPGSSANFLEYSTATGSLSPLNITGGTGGTLVARPDGNGYALALGNGNGPGSEQVLFVNSKFQAVGSWTNSGSGDFNGNPIYSADSSRLYVPGQLLNYYVDVFDANTYQYLGQIPTQGSNSFFAVDGQNRLLSPSGSVLALVDGNAKPGTIPTVPEILGFIPALSPDNPASGYTATLSTGSVTTAPQIAFSGTLATNVHIASSNTISLTAPKIQNLAQAELTAVFPDGTTLIAPDAYSYQPTILYTDQDGSAQNGGSTLNIYGLGLDFSADELGVKIGGNTASNVSAHFSPDSAPVVLRFRNGASRDAEQRRYRGQHSDRQSHRARRICVRPAYGLRAAFDGGALSDDSRQEPRPPALDRYLNQLTGCLFADLGAN